MKYGQEITFSESTSISIGLTIPWIFDAIALFILISSRFLELYAFSTITEDGVVTDECSIAIHSVSVVSDILVTINFGQI